MKNSALLPAIALVFSITSLHAQKPFPLPEKDVERRSDADDYDQARSDKLGERYKDLWALGKGRWKNLEARFKKPEKTYTAIVEKMDFDANGKCVITFRAWYDSFIASMQSKTFSIGKKSGNKDLDKLPRFPAPGIALTLGWEKTDTPPPFAVGSPVTLGTDKDGNVICSILTVFDISAVRLGPTGNVEVILQTEKSDGVTPPEDPYFGAQPSKKMMYVKPDFTNLQLCGRASRYTNVLWDKDGGIVIAALDEEAGDDVTESMIGLTERLGIPVVNHPTFRFHLGADGWKKFQDLPYNIGAIGFEYLIPPSQFITIRDGYSDMGSKVFDPPLPASAWIFQDSSTRLLTAAELRELDQDTLWKVKNEIYARKGYIFSSPRGRAYAASLGDAYVGRTKDQDAIAKSFNSFEKQNIALIATFIK